MLKSFALASALSLAALPGAAAPGARTGDLSPIAAGDWNYDRAAHLLERAGFGGTPDSIEALAAMSPRNAVRHLGAAGPMFIMGQAIEAGFHRRHPGLTDLDENGDLTLTADFRRVYATGIKEWLGYQTRSRPARRAGALRSSLHRRGSPAGSLSSLSRMSRPPCRGKSILKDGFETLGTFA